MSWEIVVNWDECPSLEMRNGHEYCRKNKTHICSSDRCPITLRERI